MNKEQAFINYLNSGLLSLEAANRQLKTMIQSKTMMCESCEGFRTFEFDGDFDICTVCGAVNETEDQKLAAIWKEHLTK